MFPYTYIEGAVSLERNYDFCKRLLEVHKKDRRDHSIKPNENEFVFTGPVAILMPQNSGIVVETAARDFADYLFTSMNVPAYVTYDSQQDLCGAVRLRTNKDLAEASQCRGHRVTVDKSVLVEGYDENGIAQALYYLEDVMNLRQAPYLPKGSITRRVMFNPRTVMSGYGYGEYPDAYLAQLAHHGFSGIMRWIKGVNEDQKGFQNFNDLAFRAQKYGLDIYIESYTPHDVYPEGEEAQAFYDRLYGDLFRQFPFIKGLTILGEAVNFPSRDPSIPEGIKPGWWPCSDWPKLLKMVQNAVHKVRPDAQIILSSYNWGKQDKALRQKLIASLPEGILLNCGWEMFQQFELEGMPTQCYDYSLRIVNPGYYFLTEAEAAVKRGIKLETIANTGGKTWDIGAIPYDPAPYRWAERFEALRKAHDENNLAALLDSIHYGVHPSFITEIAKWAFAEPRVDLNALIPQIIAMHFGKQALPQVDAAMKKWSEAFSNAVPSVEDQYGALRVGPSHPFYAGRTGRWDGASPPQDKFAATKLGYGMYEAVYVFRDRPIPGPVRITHELKAFFKFRDLMKEGLDILETVQHPNEELMRLTNMGWFIYRTLITAIHRKQYHILDMQRQAAKSKAEGRSIIDKMLCLLKAERENAEKAIPLVEFDSALGFEPSIEYVCDAKRIQWKLQQIDEEMALLKSWME